MMVILMVLMLVFQMVFGFTMPMEPKQVTPMVDVEAGPVEVEAEVMEDAMDAMPAAVAPGGGGMMNFGRMEGATISHVILDDAMLMDNDDEYAPLSDPGYARTATKPLSTFAADVDTAAYGVIRRLINDQQLIPKDAVRVEEMVNAFSYKDPAPEGDDPIATHTQVAPCPWNEDHLLMRIGLKAIEIDAEALPPSNLVFLIDSSGSMDMPDRLPLVQRSFALLAEQLRPEDRVSVVTYSGYSSVLLEGARGDAQSEILNAIDDIFAGGGTAGADGLKTAYEIAERYAAPGMNSRVILATDGDFNIGIDSEAELIRLIEEKKEGGVFLTVLGYGMGNYKDDRMQAMAEHGNGNASYIDTIHQARQALVTEFGATMVTVAKDVKLQVEFNPETVEGYRLLGYETRRMADEDFRDDAKDGGEIGSGHSMVALYELIPAGAGELGEAGLVYQQAASTGSTDYATVYLRYKEPTGDKAVERKETVGAENFTDAPNDDFTLSAAVAAFAQLLMDSEFKGDADEQMVLSMLQPLLSGDETGRVVELSTLVRRSAGLYGE